MLNSNLINRRGTSLSSRLSNNGKEVNNFEAIIKVPLERQMTSSLRTFAILDLPSEVHHFVFQSTMYNSTNITEVGCGNQERGASKFTTRGFCEKEIVLKGCLTVCAPLSYQFQVSTETFTGVTITEAWCLALGLADRPCKRNKTRLEKPCWNCNE